MSDQQRTGISKLRRLLAAILSLAGAGFGHASLGHWRLTMLWYGADLGFTVAALASAILGSAWGFETFLAATWGTRITSLVTTLRLTVPKAAPTIRSVVSVTAGLVILSVVLGDYIQGDLLDAARVTSEGMYPTIQVGDTFLAVKEMRHPGRGDVVVFTYPDNPAFKHVRRIVGIGQDVIETRAGELIVNGKRTERRITKDRVHLFTIAVPFGRKHSAESSTKSLYMVLPSCRNLGQ